MGKPRLPVIYTMMPFLFGLLGVCSCGWYEEIERRVASWSRKAQWFQEGPYQEGVDWGIIARLTQEPNWQRMLHSGSFWLRKICLRHDSRGSAFTWCKKSSVAPHRYHPPRLFNDGFIGNFTAGSRGCFQDMMAREPQPTGADFKTWLESTSAGDAQAVYLFYFRSLSSADTFRSSLKISSTLDIGFCWIKMMILEKTGVLFAMENILYL